LDHKAPPVHRVRRVTLVHRVLLVQPELQDRRVRKAMWDLRVQRVHKA
jgi:hypothetical protein